MRKITKEEIIATAQSIGINDIGFTQMLSYDYLKEHLETRQKLNYNNEFEENNINKRLKASNVFSNCKTIISAVFPYGEGYKKPETSEMGIISVSSFGEDYHSKVKKQLEIFAEKLNKLVKFEYKTAVDTTSLIDREICVQSGLGGYGLNSMLLHPLYGSFVFLGYLLTDLDIYDIYDVRDNKNKIKQNICNGCGICVKSCPNGAIMADGTINSHKCVSYLTQTKEYIPIEYRKNMSNKIYGCDECQLSCPKNKYILSLGSSNNYGDVLIDLDEILAMSNKDFKNKYGNMSGSWRGKNIWKRNSIIAIANLGLDSKFDKVAQELKNPSDMMRIYAAWSIVSLNRNKGGDIINKLKQYETQWVKDEYNKILEEV